MKKILAFFLFAALGLSAWAQEKDFKPFGIKSGYMKTVTMKGKEKLCDNYLWFDDFGRKEKGVTTTYMGADMGSFDVTTIFLDGQCWMISDDGEVKELEGRPELRFDRLSDKEKKDLKFKDLGTEQYKGKLCNKYYYEQKQLVKSRITVWVWKGIIIRQHIKQTFGETMIELEELQENARVPASTFTLPKGKK